MYDKQNSKSNTIFWSYMDLSNVKIHLLELLPELCLMNTASSTRVSLELYNYLQHTDRVVSTVSAPKAVSRKRLWKPANLEICSRSQCGTTSPHALNSLKHTHCERAVFELLYCIKPTITKFVIVHRTACQFMPEWLLRFTLGCVCVCVYAQIVRICTIPNTHERIIHLNHAHTNHVFIDSGDTTAVAPTMGMAGIVRRHEQTDTHMRVRRMRRAMHTDTAHCAKNNRTPMGRRASVHRTVYGSCA